MKSLPSLCVRSLDVSQASPFLEMAWEKIRQESPSSNLLLLDQPMDVAPIITGATSGLIKDNHKFKGNYKNVLSWSIPNERTLEDITQFSGVTTTPGPLNAVYKLSDKRATKVLFERFLLPTPQWEILDREFTRGELIRREEREELECQLLNHLSFPIVLKPLWDCMGHGIEIIDDQKMLLERLTNKSKNTLLAESFVDGDLGCIEIIGNPENYYFQPPCLTGQSKNGVLSNFDTVRICHPKLFSNLLTQEIKNKLINLLEYLDFSGACCVDFIATNDEISFLEVNPRISGISCLSSAASGVNSFEATYLVSSGQWSSRLVTDIKNSGASVQLGGRYSNDYISLLREYESHVKIFRDDFIFVDEKKSRNIIAGGDVSSIELFLNEISYPYFKQLSVAV